MLTPSFVHTAVSWWWGDEESPESSSESCHYEKSSSIHFINIMAVSVFGENWLSSWVFFLISTLVVTIQFQRKKHNPQPVKQNQTLINDYIFNTSVPNVTQTSKNTFFNNKCHIHFPSTVNWLNYLHSHLQFMVHGDIVGLWTRPGCIQQETIISIFLFISVWLFCQLVFNDSLKIHTSHLIHCIKRINILMCWSLLNSDS